MTKELKAFYTIASTTLCAMNFYYELTTIESALVRLEKLEKENQILKKALDKACERLDWDCPVSQRLVDDLDCENCKNTVKECWKKYFLKEVE